MTAAMATTLSAAQPSCITRRLVSRSRPLPPLTQHATTLTRVFASAQAKARWNQLRVSSPVTKCQAQQSARVAAPMPGNPVLMAAVEALFKFPPFFNMASKNARNMIIKRAESLGLDWSGAMRELQAQDWQALMKAVEKPGLQYPDYYTKPFHAYVQGNLCWEAALEVTLAAKSVHALVMDPDGKKLDPEGDARLRSSYGQRLMECLQQLGVQGSSIQHILDMGCATGLSSLALWQQFPNATITGIDLSPHFLAVGQFEQRKREAATGQKEAISFVHGAAEDTGLPAGSLDMVSICLVCHELPQTATKDIFKEAHRLLRPGGVLAIMEMNPQSANFQRVMNNPFAYTAFRSTEPWLEEYITLDMQAAMLEQGFVTPIIKEATPRHKCVVAVKP